MLCAITPPPGSYQQEVSSAVRYERMISVKAAPLALVGLVIVVYLIVHG